MLAGPGGQAEELTQGWWEDHKLMKRWLPAAGKSCKIGPTGQINWGMWGLETWLSSYDSFLLPQRKWVLFKASTW